MSGTERRLADWTAGAFAPQSRSEREALLSLVPIVVEQSARGERAYDIFSRLLRDRIVFSQAHQRHGHLVRIVGNVIAIAEGDHPGHVRSVAGNHSVEVE